MMMRMRSRSGRRRHRACEASREAGLASGVSRVAPGSSFPQWDPVPASYEMVEVFGNWLAVNHVQIFFSLFLWCGGRGSYGGGGCYCGVWDSLRMLFSLYVYICLFIVLFFLVRVLFPSYFIFNWLLCLFSFLNLSLLSRPQFKCPFSFLISFFPFSLSSSSSSSSCLFDFQE